MSTHGTSTSSISRMSLTLSGRRPAYRTVSPVGEVTAYVALQVAVEGQIAPFSWLRATCSALATVGSPLVMASSAFGVRNSQLSQVPQTILAPAPTGSVTVSVLPSRLALYGRFLTVTVQGVCMSPSVWHPVK